MAILDKLPRVDSTLRICGCKSSDTCLALCHSVSSQSGTQSGSFRASHCGDIVVIGFLKTMDDEMEASLIQKDASQPVATAFSNFSNH